MKAAELVVHKPHLLLCAHTMISVWSIILPIEITEARRTMDEKKSIYFPVPSRKIRFSAHTRVISPYYDACVAGAPSVYSYVVFECSIENVYSQS